MYGLNLIVRFQSIYGLKSYFFTEEIDDNLVKVPIFLHIFRGVKPNHMEIDLH